MWDSFEVETEALFGEERSKQWLAAAHVDDVFTVGIGESEAKAVDDLKAQLLQGHLPTRAPTDGTAELFGLAKKRAARTMQLRLRRL